MKPSTDAPFVPDPHGESWGAAGEYVGLHGRELRERAASGAVLIAMRSVGVLVIGLCGYLIFARVLSPAEFGIVALGLSITFFGHFLADAGLGAALLRRHDPPTRLELASVTGLQLAVMSMATLLAVLIALLFESRTAAVTAVFLGALPLLAMRVPAAISLERELRYGPLVAVDVFEVLIFNAVAVTAVLLGSGPFGLAGATIVKALAGTIALNRLAPGFIMMPRLRLAPLREMLRFGVMFQASGAVTLVRDFVGNVLVVAIGGYAMAGLAAIAGRVINVPVMMFQAVSRVSFPAMSRLLGAGEDPRRPIERGVAIGAILAAGLLVPLAAGGPDALVFILGEPWREAGTILPVVCLGLGIGMPITVIASGYLYALGDARTVLTANLAFTVTALASCAALLPLIGFLGVGIASMAGTLVNAALLSHAVRRHTGVTTISFVIRPVGAGLVAFAAGAAGASIYSAPLAAAAAAAAASLAVYLGGLFLVDRSGVTTTARLIARSVRRVGRGGDTRRPARA